ncbi:hypothetical protein [Fluviicola taffensis]|uniref:hypothetical protein n=1 Tax=Fluviicola taffensis TaxID=191579 RepID=UPI0031381BAC
MKKVDVDLGDGNANKLDSKVVTKTDPPKDPQVANGEKPPKSQILEDDPNLKDKDLDNFKKYEDDVDASTKQKMKNDADSEVQKGKNHDSKAKALLMAMIITEANDKIDTPVSALMLELSPLKALKGVRGFGDKKNPNGTFKIVMYGSELDVKKIYTIDDGPIYRGGEEIFMSDVDIRNSVNKQGFMKKRGISLNLNKKDFWVQEKGGAFEVDYSTLPKELEIMHTKGTHYEIVPVEAGVMKMERYKELVSQIKVIKFNTIP